MRLGEDNAKLMDRCWGRGLMSVSRGLFWGVRCVLKLSCDDSAQLRKLTPIHWIRHLNRWMFIRCTLQSVKLLKTKTLMIPVILDGQFESQCVCVYSVSGRAVLFHSSILTYHPVWSDQRGGCWLTWMLETYNIWNSGKELLPLRLFLRPSGARRSVQVRGESWFRNGQA